MKRTVIILFSILLVSGLKLEAQNSYIGFSLGASIPRGDFSATDNLFSNGYAIPGFTVSFEGFYYPMPVIGIGGTLAFGSLYSDPDIYLDDLIDYAYTQSVIPIGGSPPLADDVSLESGFWNYVNLMAGPEFSVPFGRFQAGIHGLAGLTMAFYPTMEMYYEEGANTLETLAKGTSAALAYSCGASLLYRARSGTGLKLSADYLNSKASYDFDMNTVNNTGEFDLTRSEDVDIEALSITLGFFYVF
jgi:hypothetical protein